MKVRDIPRFALGQSLFTNNEFDRVGESYQLTIFIRITHLPNVWLELIAILAKAHKLSMHIYRARRMEKTGVDEILFLVAKD